MKKHSVLFMTSITQTERFVGKRQINNFGAFFDGNKDWTKAEIR